MTIPRRGWRVRWLVIATGLAVFLWLGPEDNTVWPAALLGAWVALVALAWWGMGRFGGAVIAPRYLPAAGALFGAVAGLSASAATVLLMLLKDVRHAHPLPDYPPGLLAAMIERAPAWALAGLLAGLGAALTWLALRGAVPGENSE